MHNSFRLALVLFFAASGHAVAAPPHQAPPGQDPSFELIGDPPAKVGKETPRFIDGDQDQLDKLVAEGILSKESKISIEGYARYFPAQREARLEGAKLLYFEHEEMDEWVGCCINLGFGLILQGHPSKALRTWADERGCRVLPSGEFDVPGEIKARLGKLKAEEVFKLSCHDYDLG